MNKRSRALPQRLARFGKLPVILGLSLLSLMVFFLVAWHFHREARNEAGTNLKVIVELKAHEVERWLNERRDSASLATSGDLVPATIDWLARHRPEGQAQQRLQDTLARVLRRTPDADRIDLYDARGEFLLSTATVRPHFDHLAMNDIDVKRSPRLVDFYLDAKARPRLGFIVALTHSEEPSPGFAFIEIDPARTLYPLVMFWPGSQASGELGLTRVNGEIAENVSPLQQGKIAPFKVQISTQDLQLKVPTTHTTLLQPGHDYRGIATLRAVHGIEGSPWWLGAKMDEAEILGPARASSAYAALFLVLASLALLALIHQSNRFSLVSLMHEERARHAELMKAFIDAVPESLMMLKWDGQLEFINRTGAQRLGRDAEALIGQNLYRLLPAEFAGQRREKIEEALRSKQTQSVSDCRNGRHYESMFYPISDGNRVVVIAIDVTAKHEESRQVRSLQMALQSFIDHLPGTAFVKDHESRVLMANQGFQTLLGIPPAGMIGKLSSEIFPGEFGEKIVADDLRILASGETEILAEDFAGRHYESIKFCIPRSEGEPWLGGVTLDVTARVEAEKALREREALFQTLGDNLPESYLYQIITTADGNRRFTYLSSGVERINGIKPEAIIADGNLLYATVHPEQIETLAEKETHCRDTLSDFSMELRMRRRDGEYGWFIVRSHPQDAGNGQTVWNGVITDITARQRAEILNELQARRATALLGLPEKAENMTERDFLAFAQETAEELTASQIAFIHFVNEDQESIELVAWSRNTLAHYCHASFDEHYPLSKAGIWADAARTHQAVVFNDYALAPGKRGLPDGHAALSRLITVPVIEGGKVRMLAGVGNKPSDYTETDVATVQLIADAAWRLAQKRRTEQILARTAQVVEASPAICFRWLAQDGWPVDFVSDNVRRWGYEPAALHAGQPSFASLIHADDRLRVASEIDAYLASGQAESVQEYRLRLSSGKYIWVSSYITATRDADAQVLYLDGVLADISDRKSAEARLADNLSAQAALNKKLEEAHNQLLQSEKLAAIGQLAAGVAHELNNPIGFVHSNLGTLSEYVITLINLCDAYEKLIDGDTPESPSVTEIRRIKDSQDYSYLRNDVFPLLEESREGLLRVRKIVQDLRDFSRTGSQEWSFADLHRGLDSTLNIVANELKYKCTVRKEYGEIPEVECVISQLNQVFMNLLVNAAQAIETKGEIVLSSGMLDDAHVWINISDTGQGIPPDILNRIFDPFFTTKPVGIGTGLGLSLAFSIISRHHGQITVASTPGEGSCFRIVLPIRQPANPTISQEAS